MLSCFLKPGSGGIVDDTVITRLGDDSFHLVTNAACREKDTAFLASEIASLGQSRGQIEWDILEDRGLIALQGPLSAQILRSCQFDSGALELGTIYFGDCIKLRLQLSSGQVSPPVMVTRTGYTGEDGFEVSIPKEATPDVADLLLRRGGLDKVRLAGLGARDSLRLEAGMCLYGFELDEETTPVEAGLSWIIGMDRRHDKGFHGSERILQQLETKSPKIELSKRRIGLRVDGPPARGGAILKSDLGDEIIGRVTSGGPSPTLGANIAMGYVKPNFRKVGTALIAEVRGRPQKAQVVKLPFVSAKYRKK